MTPVTILVVDDEQVILDSAKKILAPEGVSVLTAPDAETALSVLTDKAPHILITDLILPGASGMSLLEKALEHDPGLVVILTTGYSTVENAVAALKHGAFEFLPKPFTCEELVASVGRARQALESRL
jgi:two-component system, OmpR family, phosphate regulon sensor histidine kinase PhoR